MGNGAKAASKRERNAKDTKGSGKSQLKTNEAAKDIQCVVCRATFLKTTRAPALTEHAANKHSKTLQDCFPGFAEGAKK
ncbi:At2g23090 like protein [Aspergillus aurantiobrunneus]